MENLIDKALALYTQQFRESRNISNLTRSLLNNVPTLSQDYKDLMNDRWVDSAIGVQLDRMGEIIGLPRNGRSDDAYRIALQFQSFVNISSASPEVIISATRQLTGGALIKYWENYPAGFQVFTDGLDTLNITGTPVISSRLGLSDGGYLVADDGEEYLIVTREDSPETIESFLTKIKPVSIDIISIAFSLGNTPIFAFGRDFNVVFARTSEGDLIRLSDGSFLDLVVEAEGNVPEEYLGYGELPLVPLGLDDGCELAITCNTFVDEETTLAVNGRALLTLEQLILVHEGNIIRNIVQLSTDDGEGILLSDGSCLGVVFDAPEILKSPLIFDDGVEMGTPCHGGEDSEGILVLDDGCELILNIVAEEITLTPLLLLDETLEAVNGGKYAEGTLG